MIVEVTVRQLEELARMRAMGMEHARQLDRRAHGRLSPVEEAVFAKRSRGIVNDFVSVARAVRQIMVLEQELAGLRPARRSGKAPEDRAESPDLSRLPRPARPPKGFVMPLRDDLREHYDHRPVGGTVSWIRGTLGIEPPADDPFRAHLEREPPVEAEAADIGDPPGNAEPAETASPLLNPPPSRGRDSHASLAFGRRDSAAGWRLGPSLGDGAGVSRRMSAARGPP
jgi:hypothetical protein